MSRRAITWAVVTVVIAFAAAPLAWLARLSVTPDGETYAAARGFWPDSPTFDHYREVAGDPRFWRQLGNSMAVCLASTAVALLFGAWGAYGLARYRFRRRDAILTGLLALHLLPGVANMTAVYRFAELLGAIDSLLYVALLKSSGAAMAVWIMVATFRQIPDRLEFSARLDGLSSRQALWRITLPLARPGLLTAGLLLFIQSWNSFFLPFLLLEEPRKMTLTVGMYRYFSEHGFEQGAVAAFVILALAPVVALFVVFRRFLWSPHEM